MSTTPGTTGFQQRLGLFDATMLVAGTMIGSGIFVVSSTVAKDVGSSGWLIAIWVLTGIMTIIGALSYAELAAMMPHAGGQYVYLRESYSPMWGFLYGWTCFLIIQTGSIAAVAVVFAKYLGELVPVLGMGHELYTYKWPEGEPLRFIMRVPWMNDPVELFKREKFTISVGHLVAVGVVGLLSLFNCRGVQEGKWTQNILTVTKILALGLLIVLGSTVAINPEAVELNTTDPWAGMENTKQFKTVSELLPNLGTFFIMLAVAGAVMTGPLFAADAWNNVTFTAGEIRNPRRNLPGSLVLGTGLVIVLYLLANIAYMAALPVQGIETGKTAFERGIAYATDERVGTAVFELASPRFGVRFMAIAIMISTFGCVNGMILMGARLYYAMAADGLFFRSVGALNSKGVPAAGLILQGIWSVLLVFSGSYDELLDFVMFAVLLFYAVTVVGLFVLRFRQPNLERPYKALGYPIVPALYVLLCTVISGVLLIVKPQNTVPGLIIVLTGIPVYFAWRWTSRRASA